MVAYDYQLKQHDKGKTEEAKALNNFLKSIKARLYQKEADLLDRGSIITVDLLQDSYCDKVEVLKEKTLFAVFSQHNTDQKAITEVNPDAVYPIVGKIIIGNSIAQFSSKLKIEERLWNVKSGRSIGKSRVALELN